VSSPTRTPPAPGTAADQVVTTLFRALAVLRFVVMGYAVWKNVDRMGDFEHPAAAWAVVAVIVAWTALMTWAYDDPRRRRMPLYTADLAVAVLLVLSTPFIQSQTMLDQHAAHMPTFWVMASVLAWAVGRGWPAGLLAAAVVSLADVSVKVSMSGATWGNIFLLLLGAGMLGYTASLLREAVELRAAADRASAAAEERARLARAVHDGALQVLALVQRRGLELGGEFAELGRLAAEQEVKLRVLVQEEGSPLGPAVGVDAGLVAALARFQSATVSLSAPAEEVRLPVPVVAELVAAVGECLANVTRHIGPAAPAWVLVEDLGASVVISVRDGGPGIPQGRLHEAAGEGRLGVRESIVGRLRALGGSAELSTGPHGSDWELRVPTSR
jgi:signal transduction histidine kinase